VENRKYQAEGLIQTKEKELLHPYRVITISLINTWGDAPSLVIKGPQP